MKKAGRIIAFLLATFISIGTSANMNVFADSPPDGFDIRNGVLVKYNGSAADVTVPDGVTAIGDEAFETNYPLKTVVIPNSVSSIGSHAFEGCTNLSSVTLGKGLKTIGFYAFHGCIALVSIEIPVGTTSIGDSAFCYSGLESVTLPVGLTSIGDGAFRNTKLTSVIIPEGVTKIGDNAFSDCTALANITFPTSLTDFGREVFDRTKWVTEYPDNFIIVNGILIAFRGRGDITVPGTVKKISRYTFSSNLGLTHVTIPEGVTEIGDHAFEYDTNLTGISLPDSLTRIGKYAFQGSGLTGIVLPGHLTELGSFAFDSCASLKTASVPGSLKHIGDHAFIDCRALSGVELGAGVESIGETAFYNCSALQTISFPYGLKTIESSAFDGCSKLPVVSLPNSITYLCDSAFMFCSSLSSLTLSTGLTKLGPQVFRNCYALKTLSIPNGVKKLEAGSFLGCSLTSAVIPASVEFIDANAFNTGGAHEVVPKIYGYDGTEAQRFAAKYDYTFVSLGTVPIPLRLDTTGVYDFGSRTTYFYLAKTGSQVAPKAVSSNPKAIAVSFEKKVNDGYLFRITRLSPGTAVITTTLGSESASFTAVSSGAMPDPSAYTSDTTHDFSVNGAYTFKITSKDSSVPTFVVGTPGVFDVQLVSVNGADYYFKLTAIGAPGMQAGIYVNHGPRLLTATVGSNPNYAKLDTGKQLTVKAGKTYQFEVTASRKPIFVCGTPSTFHVMFSGSKGNNYFFKVTAIGRVGESAGFYVNGEKTPRTVGRIS